ncbi:MAG: hypothetical protein H6719_18735 [Sandaracinaceae bacterium]|nr:hypothetical protein [Sandaracinaceae bacterium]
MTDPKATGIVDDDVDLSKIPGGGGGGAKWVAIGVLVLVLGGIGAGIAYFVTTLPATDPARVVVALRGSVDPEFDANIRQDFHARLHNFGFDAIEDEVPVEGADLEAAYAEVRRRGLEREAGTTLLLDLSVVAERPGVVTDQQLFRAALSVHVVPTEGGDVGTETAEFTYENTTARNVATGLRDTWFATLAPAAIDLLYQSPALERVLDPETSLEASRMTYVLTLRDKADLVNARTARVEAFEQYRRAGLEEATRTGSEEDIHCFGDPSRPWSVIGIDGDGSHVIVQESYRNPVFRLESMRDEWTEPPESLRVIEIANPESPRTLLSVGHFYTLAETSPDGAWASAALFARGVPALVSVKIEDGSFGTRWLLEAGERVPFHQPSPDGQAILARLQRSGWYIWDRENALPVPAVRDSRFIRLPSGEGRIVGQIGSDLALLEPNGRHDEPWPRLPHPLHEVLGVVDGSIAVSLRLNRTECEIVRVDLATHTAGPPSGAMPCLSYGSVLPDGRVVGAANHSASGDPPGDMEVVLFDPQTAGLTVLTRGTTRDELVYASSSGNRVVWSRRLEAPPEEFDNRLFRRAVCWADLPPP